MKTIDISPKGYKIARERSRKNWLMRELKRQKHTEYDTYSVSTLLE